MKKLLLILLLLCTGCAVTSDCAKEDQVKEHKKCCSKDK